TGTSRRTCASSPRSSSSPFWRGTAGGTERPLRRRELTAFAAASAVAFAVAFVAVRQPWIADLDEVQVALITRWMPYALVVATIVTTVVAVHLPDPAPFLTRHFVLFAAVPALLLFARLAQPVTNASLG